MHAAPHRIRSDFQLRHFIVGSCYTPDGAWILLYAQLSSVKLQVANIEANRLARTAERLEIEADLIKKSEAKRLRAQARLIMFEAQEEDIALNAQGVRDELRGIETLMAEIEPRRRYGHLSILEASEAAQSDEWLEELKHRAENCFFAELYKIPADEIKTMRMHPDWDKIAFHLQYIRDRFVQAKNPQGVIEALPKHFLLASPA